MRKLTLIILLLFLVSWFGVRTEALPTLDIYGGRTDITCATALGYFHMEQIGSRWWFCTPLGNAYNAQSVSIGAPPNPTIDSCRGNANLFPLIIAKYGDATFNWAWQTLKRVTQWGFNATAQDSTLLVSATETCSSCLWPGHVQPIPIPFIIEGRPAENAYKNTGNVLSSPLKDSVVSTNTNWQGYRGATLFDVFDPGLGTFWANSLATNAQLAPVKNNSPWVPAVYTDDSDFFSGSGATPDFVSGHTTPNPAWTTLLTSPVQTYNSSTVTGSLKLVYTDIKNYSKSNALNPVTTCSITDPCSLRDYLKQKYVTIGALNTAWGSTYTTFDSTATQVTTETFGTGDGTTTSFTHTTAHGTIDPMSVQVFVAGTMRMGDCPWFHLAAQTQCLTAPTATMTGTIGSPVANLITQQTSTINYTTGAVTINFVTAPTVGQAITISYQYGGWMQGGTGLMDEDGSHTQWVGTNAWCMEINATYSVWTACKASGSGSVGVPNANPNLGADMDAWTSILVAQYFKTLKAGLVASGSHIPYFGLDIVGSYGTPGFSAFLQGEAPYVDGFFQGGLQQIQSSNNTEWLARVQYFTQYIGNKPFMMFVILQAPVDSNYSCHPVGTPGGAIYPNQVARGLGWFNEAQGLLTTPSFSGTIQLVGMNFWNWQDFQNLNQGLITQSDNAYDGIESSSCVSPCDAYYTVLAGVNCGGELGNYGDAITGIKNGNALWLQ
jgi:hypothetical protein